MTKNEKKESPEDDKKFRVMLLCILKTWARTFPKYENIQQLLTRPVSLDPPFTEELTILGFSAPTKATPKKRTLTKQSPRFTETFLNDETYKSETSLSDIMEGRAEIATQFDVVYYQLLKDKVTFNEGCPELAQFISQI